ncbi:unnamed protein product [Thlaspi arvense]|uniref:SET domain-containing protein n=1 Tax=Thlaspi arvense TaxID=13288 RepID=A0AAU9SE40_THLAR|nr:unnamed protein product [Thlaspi arvense]
MRLHVAMHVEIPYNYDGNIVYPKSLLYECGPLCKCPSACYLRVTQRGIRFKLEIFKTESRGWGVRSLSSIPSGNFICEYVVELLEDKEAERRTGNDEYLFDIGNKYDNSLAEGMSKLMPGMEKEKEEEDGGDGGETTGFTVAKKGNIGRFINHSCSPNLYAQNVLYDHEDKRIPHVMLCAMDNIPPLQELQLHDRSRRRFATVVLLSVPVGSINRLPSNFFSPVLNSDSSCFMLFINSLCYTVESI